jgi:hypothetical protein
VSQRFDGFVSLDAKTDGGEIVTKPLTFRARALYLNIVSQGRRRAVLLDWTYRPIDGFALGDCEPIVGDSTAYRVNWKGGSLEKLARRPVRLQLVLDDAKLFALQFE